MKRPSSRKRSPSQSIMGKRRKRTPSPNKKSKKTDESDAPPKPQSDQHKNPASYSKPQSESKNPPSSPQPQSESTTPASKPQPESTPVPKPQAESAPVPKPQAESTPVPAPKSQPESIPTRKHQSGTQQPVSFEKPQPSSSSQNPQSESSRQSPKPKLPDSQPSPPKPKPRRGPKSPRSPTYISIYPYLSYSTETSTTSINNNNTANPNASTNNTANPNASTNNTTNPNASTNNTTNPNASTNNTTNSNDDNAFKFNCVLGATSDALVVVIAFLYAGDYLYRWYKSNRERKQEEDIRWEIRFGTECLKTVSIGPVNAGEFTILLQADPPQSLAMIKTSSLGTNVLQLTCFHADQNCMVITYRVKDVYAIDGVDEVPEFVSRDVVQRSLEKTGVTQKSIEWNTVQMN